VGSLVYLFQGRNAPPQVCLGVSTSGCWLQAEALVIQIRVGKVLVHLTLLVVSTT
jgi:hypothetical protein